MHGNSLAATRMVWLLYTDLGTEQPDHLRSQSGAFDEIARSLVESGTAILISSSAHTRELAFDDIASLLRGVLTLYRASKRACDRSQRHCVRMAVHAGIAHDRNGKLEGPSLTRAVRLRAIANDGQILFSGSAHDLALGNLPAGIALRSLGSHRLKEIASPERIYQLVAPDLSENFPPLRTPSAVPNNLIVPTSNFIGRSAEIRRVADSLASERLITLAGPGGVGKTRLATVIAANALSHFPDGVWMVELAPFHDISSVPSILAFHFGVRNIGDRPLIDAVIDTMRNKRALLVFDNCEHLITDLKPIISTIIAEAADVRVMTTTRTALGLDGECVERIGSLRLPPLSEKTQTSLERYDSVALFIDRAKAIRADLQITSDSLEIIARICRRLDGIPLAIELAAARISAFELDEIESMLARRFELLVSDDTTMTARQQTLRGLIDWSFALLSAEQRRIFTTISIFVGTFGLDDVREICATASDDTATTLAALVDRSLVVGEFDDDIAEIRYHLLESTREYGMEQLKTLGELQSLELRHARHYARVAGEHERRRSQTPLSAWLQRVERDYENFAVAINRATDHNESETAAKIICRLREYWPSCRPDDCRRLLTSVLKNAAHLDTATLADLWLTDALLANRLRDDRKTLESSIVAIAYYESGKVKSRGHVSALRMRSFARTMMGDIDLAEADAHAAIALGTEIGDERESSRARVQLAQALLARGEYARAAAILRESVDTARRMGERIDVILQDLAESEFWSGNVSAAIETIQQSIRITLDDDPSAMPIGSYVNLAAYLISLDRYEDARIPARESLRMSLIIGHRYVIAVATMHLAAIALALGDTERGARLVGFSDALHAIIDQQREQTEAMERARIGTILDASLSKEQQDTYFRLGATMTDDAAVDFALAV